MKALFWGRSVCDLTYKLNDFPAENDKVFADEFLIQPGGTALNPAITFAALAGESFLISRLGNNDLANILKNKLRNYGVRLTDLAEDKDYQIPLSSIIVNSGKDSRTIINSPNNKKSENFNIENIISVIDEVNPGIIQIDGFELENNYDVLEYSKKKNIKIIFDGGSWKEETEKYLKYIDIAICSGKFRIPGLLLDETIIKLHEYGIKFVAFTQDEKPIISSVDNNRVLIPVEKIDAVDTLGAGDVFHGAFCYYFLKGNDFNTSLKKASQIASKSCTCFGTHTYLNKL